MFSNKENAVGEVGFVDAFLEFVLEALVVGCGFSANNHGEVRVFFEQGDGGLDEEIDAFLVSDPAENTDAVFAWEPEFFPEGGAVVAGEVGAEIDPVRDDDIGSSFNVGVRHVAGRDDGVRLADEVARDPAVVPLGGGGEGNFDFCAEAFFENERLDHLVIASGVKDARAAVGQGGFAERDELLEGDAGDVIGKVVVA